MARLAPGVASANDGIGGTGGGGEFGMGLGGGERDRMRGGETVMEGVLRCPGRLGEEGEREEEDEAGEVCALSVLRVPNSSPSIHSSDWAL